MNPHPKRYLWQTLKESVQVLCVAYLEDVRYHGDGCHSPGQVKDGDQGDQRGQASHWIHTLHSASVSCPLSLSLSLTEWRPWPAHCLTACCWLLAWLHHYFLVWPPHHCHHSPNVIIWGPYKVPKITIEVKPPCACCELCACFFSFQWRERLFCEKCYQFRTSCKLFVAVLWI